MFKHFPFIHNHGDFVHLDALREWLRGVVSLDTFSKYHNDKAIVKDMHFTDEETSVDYIDTNDDTEKVEVLCKYLTSSVFDPNSTVENLAFNKVDHVRFTIDKNKERWIDVKEKANGNWRQKIFRSNVPIAYEANDDYATSTNRTAHVGINEYGLNIYSDDTLKKTKGYSFAKPAAYNVDDDNYDSAPKAYYFGFNKNGVKIFNSTTKEVVQRYQYKDTFTIQEMRLDDCEPFGTITNQKTSESLAFSKSSAFDATTVNNVVIGGQIMYTFDDFITLEAGKSIVFMCTPSSMGAANFSRNVYPKVAMIPNHSNIITNIMKNPSFPVDNNTPTVVTLFNTSDNDIQFKYIHFTF